MAEKLPVVKSGINQPEKKNLGEKIVSYLIPAAVFDCGSFKLLVELVTGGVVVDIDSSYVVNIPGLDEISMNELSVMEQGFKLGRFTAKDISLGVNSFRVESIIADLLAKKLVTIVDKKYEVTDRFKIMYNIENYAANREVVVEEVDGTKLDAKVPLARIRERIEGIIRINDTKECWILYRKT
jgi:hypothetical protein